MQIHLREPGETISKIDLVAATVIAVAMCGAFSIKGSGNSLICTFVPGVIFSYGLCWLMYKLQRPLPPPSKFLPLYFVTLSFQFLHFAEEHNTGFADQFPPLYAGLPYPDSIFVTFNMVWYCIFTLSAILVFVNGLRVLLMPTMFFIVYGALGNAIAHPTWCIYLGRYFPGLYTSLAYWILSPLLIHKLIGSWKLTAIAIALFTAVLVPILIMGMK